MVQFTKKRLLMSNKLDPSFTATLKVMNLLVLKLKNVSVGKCNS